jgi:quercetin dioxygenase-like cupin family protein
MQKHMLKLGTVLRDIPCRKEDAMKRTSVIVAVIFALGIVVGGLGHQLLSAQQEPVTRTVLLKTDVAGADGKEAVVVVAEIAPGATTGKHLHAGQEFAYILEGSLRLTVDGKPTVTFKPGEAFQQPPRQVHEGQNASATAPVKILAFYIAEKGQPLTTAVPK